MPFDSKLKRAQYMREYRRRRPQGGGSEASGAPQQTARTERACKSHPASAAGVISWAEERLRVPTGPLQGELFNLGEWQRRFVTGAMQPGIREAGLSVARKNGKSGLIAALLLAHLVGPMNSPRWRGVVSSLTGALAGELRDAIAATAEVSDLVGVRVYRSPLPGRIEGLQGARLDFLAADRGTGHGVGADLAVIDEAGLLQETQRELWAAMLSSTSARDGRLLAISIRGDGPMFRELADRAGDAGVVWQEHAPPVGCALDDVAAWHLANPGLSSGIKSLSYMEDAARRAIANQSDAGLFRAFDLNQPQAPTREMIVSVGDWSGVVVQDQDLPPRDGRVVVGVDLGGSSSMTAAVAVWPGTGRVEVWAAFPDTPDLMTRGRADDVGRLYLDMERRGELRVYAGRVTPVDRFLLDVARDLAGQQVLACGADRFRKSETQQVLQEAGLDWAMEWRGQGASSTADGSHDIRALQRVVLDGQIRTRESLVLASAIASSSISRDALGNPRLDKARSRGRIDALSALVIAAGLCELSRTVTTSGGGYLGMVQ